MDSHNITDGLLGHLGVRRTDEDLDACQVDDRCQGGGWGAGEICGVSGAGGAASCK